MKLKLFLIPALLINLQSANATTENLQRLFKTDTAASSNSLIMQGCAWRELECDALFKKINRTQTAFGTYKFNELAQPIANIDEIKYRQAIVKRLVNNPLMRLELDTIFKQISSSQNDFLKYWTSSNEDKNENIEALYYAILGTLSNKLDAKLNRSRIALEGAYLFDIARSMVNLVGTLGMTGISQEQVVAAVDDRPIDWKHGIKNGLIQPFHLHSPYPYVYKESFNENKLAILLSIGTAGDLYTLFIKGCNCPKSAAVALSALTVFASDCIFLGTVKSSFSKLASLQKTTRNLQTRMVNVAHLFKQLSILHTVAVKHQDVLGKQLCDDLNLMNKSQTMKQLCSLLQTSTFNAPSDYFFSRGRVLLANKLLEDVKDECATIMSAAGTIEAYFSMAQWYNEQTSLAPVCFVDFKEQNEPHLALENFWTPLITTSCPVLNSIFLDKTTHTKMLLTGPNGTGKSTVMKSMAHAIILAQSFGIAAAQNASMQPFSMIRSSICPSEDLQKNLSTFMAEKTRMDEISTAIKGQKDSQYSFVLLDEPYRGTVEAEAAYRVCEFGKDIARYNNCMMVLATHLQAPIELQNQTNTFANYQLDLQEAENRFIRTFKLIPGAALWWFDDVLKRRRFIDQLLI